MDKRAQKTRKRGEMIVKSVMDQKPKLNKAEALKKLREMAAKQDRARIVEKPQRLPVNDIRCFPAVFQPRPMDSNQGSISNRHIQDFTMTLKSRPDVELPPVSVMRIGNHWVLIEGHHRLSAYLTVGRADIPVEVIEGGLEEARGISVKRNSRNQLPMYRKDRAEASWGLVNCGSWVPSATTGGLRWKTYHKQAEIADIANVDLRTVEKQVQIRKRIAAMTVPNEWTGEPDRLYTDEEIEVMPYWKAMKIANGESVDDSGRKEYDLDTRTKHYKEKLRKALPAGAWREIEAISAALIALNENGAGRVAAVINDTLGGEEDE